MRRLLWLVAVVMVAVAPVLPVAAQDRLDPPVAPPPPPAAAPLPPAVLVIPRPAPVTSPVLAREPAGTLRGFVADLLDGLDVYWGASFAREGVPYTSPNPVWVTVAEPAATACRPLRVVVAPVAYCEADQAVYLSLPFLEHWWARSQGMAVVLTLAIAWGGHAQNLLGIGADEYGPYQRDLQADCFAGMFVRYADARGWLRSGDREHAISIMREGPPDGWPIPGESSRLAGGSDERASAFESGYNGIPCGGFTQIVAGS